MEFKGSPTSSIGIEIELQLLDPDTLDLIDGNRLAPTPVPTLEGVASGG
jgi:hypothetical protein